MKKTPRKKSNSDFKFRHNVVELPSNNDAMEKYVLENRIEINSKIVEGIEYALENKLGGVELFSFKNSNFVVVLHRKDFKETLENIYEFSVSKEKFELCARIKKLTLRLDKIGLIFNLKTPKK
jgi:hypothetical protein